MITHVNSRLAIVLAIVVPMAGCFSDPLVGATANTTEPSSESEADSESGADSMAEMETDTDTDTDTGSDDPIPLASTADDGQIYVNGGRYTWLPWGEDSGGFIGEYPQGSAYAGYFRFAIPSALPDGATILEARLTLTGTTVHDWNLSEHALEIAVQDAADAPEVDLGAMYPYDQNPDSVALLASRVRWPESGGLTWTLGMSNESPDLAPLIQELVDANGGLAAGAHVQFWITKAAPLQMPSEVGFIEFSGNPQSAASLSLSFE